ncbi:carbohydrate porin [Klebsiella oxytoca]|uniref:carbohydrate porin n=1 Tax=Klebsiella oxytoca TaxID=571 RepID=UPI003570CF8A
MMSRNINIWKTLLCLGVITYGSSALASDATTNKENSDAPLSGAGAWLKEHGVTPHLYGAQMWIGNPSVGTTSGRQDLNYTLLIGALDADLDKMGLIPGGSIHFVQLWVPFRDNESMGMSNDGVLAGNTTPYIPKVAHLMRFGYEQKLFDDRLSIEVGKSHPSMFVAANYCNVSSSCANAMLSPGAVFGPGIYSGWGAHATYHYTPTLSSTFGAWRTYTSSAYSNGWEGWNDKYDSGTNLWVANVARHADWKQELYPFNWEVLAYYNDLTYDDLYYTVNGTSKVYDTTSAVRTHKGTSGIYITASKALWRADGGSDPKDDAPGAITMHGSLTQSLRPSNVYQGVSTQADLGLTWYGPWRSRPHDSYGLVFRTAHLASNEQRNLQETFEAAGGTGWSVPNNEYQLGVDASFLVTPVVNLTAQAAYVWNNTNWGNAYVGAKPNKAENGWTFWIQGNVDLGTLLGL